MIGKHWMGTEEERLLPVLHSTAPPRCAYLLKGQRRTATDYPNVIDILRRAFGIYAGSRSETEKEEPQDSGELH